MKKIFERSYSDPGDEPWTGAVFVDDYENLFVGIGALDYEGNRYWEEDVSYGKEMRLLRGLVATLRSQLHSDPTGGGIESEGD